MPTPDYRSRFLTAIMAQKHAFGRPLRQDEMLDVLQTTAELLIAEAVAASRKERKKANVAEGAEAIYDAYPKHVGRDDALKSITKAMKSHPIEYLLDKTSQFAAAVNAWPTSYRYYQDGGDRCPHPSTWYNQGRYADDPKEWRRSGARSAPNRPQAPASATPADEAQQALEAEQMRQRYLALPEPAKGTLEHSLWLEARAGAATDVSQVVASMTAPVKQAEHDLRLRQA